MAHDTFHTGSLLITVSTGVSKVLAKEMAPFGVHVLTVALGSFDTNMGPSVKFTRTPMPADYEGIRLDKVYQVMEASATEGFPADGDHLKAAKVIYEVVTGIGFGEGKEAARLLPLGRDMAKRVDDVVAGYQETMEVFRDVCNSVYIEKRAYSSWS